MDSIQELIDRYTRAQEDIEAEIEKQPRGTVKEYESTLTEKILAILAGLYLYTTKWSGKNVEKYYDTAMDDAVGAAQKEYRRKKKKPPAMGAKTAADSDAVSILRRNLEADLTGSVDFVGRQMQDEIRQAGLRASMEAAVRGEATEIMQQNLKQMLIDRGIPAIEYTRNGKKVYMQLDTYAELVARTTAREARNTANINLGQRIGNTLVLMSAHNNSCPICAPYQGRVYSTVPGNPDFPYLYDTPFSKEYKTFHPRCEHVVTQYIMELHSDDENRKMRELSNRSFEIGGEGWTKAQTERAERSLRGYWKGQQRKSRIYADKKQYGRYKIVLGEDAPKTFSDFQKMKEENGEQWKRLQAEYRKYHTAEALQEQMPFVYNGKKAFVPKDTLITNIKTIAGAGVKREIDIIDRLIGKYGGTAGGWTKKVGKIESAKYIFDVHWFEFNGTQYQTKIKHMKEKKL